SQRRSPVARAVEQSPPCVQALRNESNRALLREERISKAEQSVDGVCWRPAVAPFEAPVTLEISRTKERSEGFEVMSRDVPFDSEEDVRICRQLDIGEKLRDGVRCGSRSG